MPFAWSRPVNGVCLVADRRLFDGLLGMAAIFASEIMNRVPSWERSMNFGATGSKSIPMDFICLIKCTEYRFAV